MNSLRLRPLASLLALVLASPLAACNRDSGGSGAGAAPAPPASAEPKKADAPPPEPPPPPPAPPGGREGRTLFGAALQDLQLSDAQREALKGLEADLRVPDASDPTAFTSKLAAAIRAGAIDERAIEAALGGSEREARRRAYSAALQKLHKTLTPEQRKELVSKTLERLDEREARLDRPRPRRDDRSDGNAGRGLDRLLRRIELREGQRAQIEKALADARIDVDPGAERQDLDGMRAQRRSLLEAFAKDDFDAEAALAGKGGVLDGQPRRMIAAMKVVLPLLDEGQRAELADRLERGSMHRGGKDRPPPPPP